MSWEIFDFLSNYLSRIAVALEESVEQQKSTNAISERMAKIMEGE